METFLSILALYTPIAAKFEEGMQNDSQATGYITSVTNYFKLRKLKIADGHHFENGNVIRYTCISAAVKKARKKERKKKHQM